MAETEKKLLLAFTDNQQFVVKAWQEGNKFSVQTSKEYQRFEEKSKALEFAMQKINRCIDTI